MDGLSLMLLILLCVIGIPSLILFLKETYIYIYRCIYIIDN